MFIFLSHVGVSFVYRLKWVMRGLFTIRSMWKIAPFTQRFMSGSWWVSSPWWFVSWFGMGLKTSNHVWNFCKSRFEIFTRWCPENVVIFANKFYHRSLFCSTMPFTFLSIFSLVVCSRVLRFDPMWCRVNFFIFQLFDGVMVFRIELNL